MLFLHPFAPACSRCHNGHMQQRRVQAAVFFFLSAVLMVGLVFVPFSWAGLQPEVCGVQNCYCEPFRTGFFVKQPVTALSNLGYVLVGALILASAPATANLLGRGATYRRWFAAAAVAAGLASYLSHASLTRAGEWLDLMGVYQLLLLLLVYSLQRLTGRTFLTAYAAALLILALQMIYAPAWQQAVIAALLAAWVVVEFALRRVWRPRGRNRYALLALVLFAAGAGIWAANGQSPVCPPGAFPWHVAWHLLSAAAFGLLYRYYQTETLSKPQNTP